MGKSKIQKKIEEETAELNKIIDNCIADVGIKTSDYVKSVVSMAIGDIKDDKGIVKIVIKEFNKLEKQGKPGYERIAYLMGCIEGACRIANRYKLYDKKLGIMTKIKEEIKGLIKKGNYKKLGNLVESYDFIEEKVAWKRRNYRKYDDELRERVVKKGENIFKVTEDIAKKIKKQEKAIQGWMYT